MAARLAGADGGEEMRIASKLLSTFTALALVAIAGDANAQSASGVPAAPAARVLPQPTRNVGFLLRMNFDFGGDELIELQWDDGDETTLKAGQLMTFAAGVLYRRPDAPWAVEATLGYKFDQANGDNGSIKFTRIPLDLVASFAHGGHRIGGGATAHLSPSFSCDADGVCDGTIDYDTALGGILQYAYGFRVGANSGFDVGLRYTFIEYSGSDLPSLDGSGVGFFFGGRL
jgi:hypothetical protein